MENIKVKKANKKIQAWLARQARAHGHRIDRVKFVVQGMDSSTGEKKIECYEDWPVPSDLYSKDTPYWQANNFLFWEPCPSFVAFGIVYQVGDPA